MSSTGFAAGSVESRWEAAPAVVAVVALQCVLATVSLAHDWTMSGMPGWVWLVPVPFELALVAVLALPASHRRLVERGSRRSVAIAAVAVVAVANALALGALVAALARGGAASGGQLLLEALTIWSTNVILFGLVYWEVDAGGPTRRAAAPGEPADFQFPQQENPGLAAPGWRPGVVDYLYVSFTNAIAFSPTDAMPLSQRAKALMLVEASVSALTVLLVAARAVNILV